MSSWLQGRVIALLTFDRYAARALQSTVCVAGDGVMELCTVVYPGHP